jgi:ribonuclease P protein component
MSRGARKEGLSRRHRFCGSGLFTAALRSPRKLRSSKAILHLVNGTPGCSRFGLALPRRMAPRSVDRNRMKRLAREIFRRHAVKGSGIDLVLAPKVRYAKSDEEDWKREIVGLLGRVQGGV